MNKYSGKKPPPKKDWLVLLWEWLVSFSILESNNWDRTVSRHIGSSAMLGIKILFWLILSQVVLHVSNKVLMYFGVDIWSINFVMDMLNLADIAVILVVSVASFISISIHAYREVTTVLKGSPCPLKNSECPLHGK
jgi:hypothetical protein